MAKRAGTWSAALTLLGAVIGAGFASGREVLLFFARYGRMALPGAALACVSMAALAYAVQRAAARRHAENMTMLAVSVMGPRGGRAAALGFGALFLVTGAAMAAGVQETVRLVLPARTANAVGWGLAALFCVLSGEKRVAAWGGGWLLPVCLALYTAIAMRPDETRTAVAVLLPPPLGAIPAALAYAALNAALASDLLCEMGAQRGHSAAVALAGAFLLMLLPLLSGAVIVLLPNTATLLDEPLPMVKLARSLGAVGYGLCAAALLLAMTTTLTVCVRALARMLPRRWTTWGKTLCATGATLACAGIGFDTLIGVGYPILGWGSVVGLLFLLVGAFTFSGRQSRTEKS